MKKTKKIKKILHSQNFESPKIHKLIQVSRSEAPGILARRIRLFVGGFPQKTESVFFKSFRFVKAVHEHKPTWQKSQVANFHYMGRIGSPKNLTPTITKMPSEIVKFILIEFTGLLLPFPLATLSNICQGVLIM